MSDSPRAILAWRPPQPSPSISGTACAQFAEGSHFSSFSFLLIFLLIWPSYNPCTPIDFVSDCHTPAKGKDAHLPFCLLEFSDSISLSESILSSIEFCCSTLTAWWQKSVSLNAIFDRMNTSEVVSPYPLDFMLYPTDWSFSAILSSVLHFKSGLWECTMQPSTLKSLKPVFPYTTIHRAGVPSKGVVDVWFSPSAY